MDKRETLTVGAVDFRTRINWSAPLAVNKLADPDIGFTLASRHVGSKIKVFPVAAQRRLGNIVFCTVIGKGCQRYKFVTIQFSSEYTAVIFITALFHCPARFHFTGKPYTLSIPGKTKRTDVEESAALAMKHNRFSVFSTVFFQDLKNIIDSLSLKRFTVPYSTEAPVGAENNAIPDYYRRYFTEYGIIE